MDTTSLYITYWDVVTHNEVRIGPFSSDIGAIELIKKIQEIPKVSRPRVVIVKKDIDFGNKEYINIHFRN
jgi:hypothetical protein